MLIDTTITRVLSGFSGYTWLDTKIVSKNVSSEYAIVWNKTKKTGALFFVTFEVRVNVMSRRVTT